MKYEVQVKHKNDTGSEFNTMLEVFPYGQDGRARACAYRDNMRRGGFVADLKKTVREE